MNQQSSDQGWKRLQDHIEDFWGQTLKNNVQRIEYKPPFSAGLLMRSSESHQSEALEKDMLEK
jgi:hypothetical protein